MENSGQQQRINCNTQIRTLYSDGNSFMTIKFYNMNLSFSLHPFEGNNNGRNTYSRDGLYTFVNFEQAYALFKVATDILNNAITETTLTIPNQNGSVILTLKRIRANDGFNTILSISRDTQTVQFIFNKINQQVMENGIPTNRVVEAGLGAFTKTLEGYLVGVNAERHLNKYTEEYAKQFKTEKDNQANAAYQNQAFNNQTNQQRSGYRNYNYRNNNRRNYGGNNNYNRGGYSKPPTWQDQNISTANFSEYQIGQ